MADSDWIRQQSKQMLGNAYRLAVATAIFDHAGETFSTIRLAEETGIFYPRVHHELQTLEKIGLIRRLQPQGREVEYKAEPSVYWEMCMRLLDEVRTREAQPGNN